MSDICDSCSDKKELTSSCWSIGEGDAKSDACLDDADFTDANYHPKVTSQLDAPEDDRGKRQSRLPSEFSLDIQSANLRDDQEVAVVVPERSLGHRRIARIHVHGENFFRGRIAVAAIGLETLNESHVFRFAGERKRAPGVGEGCVLDAGVMGGEAGFYL